MPQIFQAGAVNTAALTVPDVDIIIVAPQLLINGSPTDILGVVGVGSWGPLNTPVTAGTLADASALVGPVSDRSHDLATVVAVGTLQGASNFRLVRVSDGTDAKATVTIPSADLTASPTFWTAAAAAINSGSGVLRGASQLVRVNGTTGAVTALYSGNVGNKVSLAVGPGSKNGTYRAVVRVSGGQPEVFDNIPAATAPTLASYALSGGTDGAAVDSADLVGSDLSPATGVFALRGQGCSVAVIADLDDATQWTTLDAFGASEACYMVHQVVFGTSIPAAVALRNAEGLDSRNSKVMHGDALHFNDAVNGLIRLVSPSSFAAAKITALAPNQSPLNKPLNGIVGSQKSGSPGSGAVARYSTAELAQLIQGGVDVICNPAPGGAYWAVRSGHNSSSNASVRTDASTRMNNFLAVSIANVMGYYVGLPISVKLLEEISSSLNSFLANLLDQGLLGSVTGQVPYRVVCDASNNPLARTGIGYVNAAVSVQTQAINEEFLINLEDGPTVSLASAIA